MYPNRHSGAAKRSRTYNRNASREIETGPNSCSVSVYGSRARASGAPRDDARQYKNGACNRTPHEQLTRYSLSLLTTHYSLLNNSSLLTHPTNRPHLPDHLLAGAVTKQILDASLLAGSDGARCFGDDVDLARRMALGVVLGDAARDAADACADRCTPGPPTIAPATAPVATPAAVPSWAEAIFGRAKRAAVAAAIRSLRMTFASNSCLSGNEREYRRLSSGHTCENLSHSITEGAKA